MIVVKFHHEKIYYIQISKYYIIRVMQCANTLKDQTFVQTNDLQHFNSDGVLNKTPVSQDLYSAFLTTIITETLFCHMS
jgi:hypothetical protein